MFREKVKFGSAEITVEEVSGDLLFFFDVDRSLSVAKQISGRGACFQLTKPSCD